MATNDFLAWAAAGGANVLSQAAYAALAAVGPGYSSGILPSENLNKNLRQSSIMASVIGAFINSQSGANAVDDGTTATLLASLIGGVQSTAGKTIQAFGTSGTFTVPAHVTRVKVTVVGGGGGGSSTSITTSGQVSVGPGGNAAAWGFGVYTVTPGATVAVTVATAAVHDTNGGSSSFGAFLSAAGGHTAFAVTSSAPPLVQAPAAGTSVATGGAVNGTESVGLPGIAGTVANAIGGSGASGPFGGGGAGTQNATGSSGSGFGSGGGGAGALASQPAYAGGTGAPGIVIVEY